MDGEYKNNKTKNIKLGNQRREQRNPKQQYGVAFPSSKAILHFIVQQRRLYIAVAAAAAHGTCVSF